MSYKLSLYVPLEFVLENDLSSKNNWSIISTYLPQTHESNPSIPWSFASPDRPFWIELTQQRIQHRLSFPTDRLMQSRHHSKAVDIDQTPSSCRFRVVWVNLGIDVFFVHFRLITQKLHSTHQTITCSSRGANLAAWTHRGFRESIGLNAENDNYLHLDCNHTKGNPCRRLHHASFSTADLYAREDLHIDRAPKITYQSTLLYIM